jgi:hypothetical protein
VPTSQPVQRGSRHAQRLVDQGFLVVGGGDTRNGVHLIQRQPTSGKPLPENRKVDQPPSHHNQLFCSRMTDTETSSHPIGQTAGAIRHPRLPDIDFGDQITDSRLTSRRQTGKVVQRLVDLIVTGITPLHTPNIRSS